MDPSPSTLDIHTKPLGQSPILETQKDPEFWPLTGKPYFYVVLNNSNIDKMTIRCKVSREPPVPAKILYRGKVWDLDCVSNQRATCKFENKAWAKFVSDNNLKVGDACVFESTESIYESDGVEFRVQIFKDAFPSELLEKAEGYNMNNPISID